jgi:mono/diheme cytochrome c family protein
MKRHLRFLLCVPAALAVALIAGACGSQNITVASSAGPMYRAATLFNQRCAGCHTLTAAAARGSAANVRTAQYNNGPNLNKRCERPQGRVLYAIENGGFSGAVMPQNIVTGQDALDVAKFVATYSGSQEGTSPGIVPCAKEPLGTIPTAAQVAALQKKSGQSASGTKSGPGVISAASGNNKIRGQGGSPAGGQNQPGSGTP